jgi:hypothetical protein
VNTLLQLASLVGVTIIICRGTIFLRLQRAWPVFFRCPLCVGFWVGALAEAVRHLREGGTWPVWAVYDLLLAGGLVGLVSMVVSTWFIAHLGEPNE